MLHLSSNTYTLLMLPFTDTESYGVLVRRVCSVAFNERFYLSN